MTRVIRAERLWLKPTRELKHLCRLAKNLYNEGNYQIRQHFFETQKQLTAAELKQTLHSSPNYQQLPFLTAEKILQQLEKSWQRFYQTQVRGTQEVQSSQAQPRLPKYKAKNGQYLLFFTKAQLYIQGDILSLPASTGVSIKVRPHILQTLFSIRIVPKGIGYILELLYTKEIPPQLKWHPRRIASIDLGVTNLITMVNNIGQQPIIVKGGVIKSINQYYNKTQAEIQQSLNKEQKYCSKRYRRLQGKHYRKLEDYLHKVTHRIIQWCDYYQIDTLIIGYIPNWKNQVKISRKAVQNFMFLPFTRIIAMLQYKAEERGITVKIIPEEYSSKCSFLDNEPLIYKDHYWGIRPERGLFVTKTGIRLNSDINAAYNILRKAVPKAFSPRDPADGIEGVWLHPRRVTPDQPWLNDVTRRKAPQALVCGT
jgi:putative transposase